MKNHKNIIITGLCTMVICICVFCYSTRVVYADNSDSNTFNRSSENTSVEGAYLLHGTNKAKYIFDELNQDKVVGLKYIDNAYYFIANPKHNENNGNYNANGICTTIAVQLLLGYHNYYSDRRLISESYLEDNYGDLSTSLLIDHNGGGKQGREDLGTKDSFCSLLLSLTSNSDNAVLGQTIDNVTDGTKNYINERATSIADSVHISSDYYSKSDAINDIDNGLPIILGMSPFNAPTKSFHVVVAYGYAYIDGVFGYLVHYGWGDAATEVWVPESWFAYQIRMSLDHNHVLKDTLTNHFDAYRELYCEICGYKTIEPLFKASDSKITGANYPINGTFKNPKTITFYNKQNATFSTETITGIAEYAFANNTEITEVVFRGDDITIGSHAFDGCVNLESAQDFLYVKEIGDYAFKGCTSLSDVRISTNISNIGIGVFSGCNNAVIQLYSSNPNYCAQDNIIYNANKTAVIATGKISENVILPSSVTEIKDSAFENNSNLYTIKINSSPTIGDNAFKNCSSLGYVYFYSNTVPVLGENSFSNNNIVIYVPYDSISQYNTAFSEYNYLITSKTSTVSLVCNDTYVPSITLHYGETISSLPSPNILGYTFIDWYDNVNFNGSTYRNGITWLHEDNIVLYAKTSPIISTVTLDPNGGTISGNSQIEATFDQLLNTDASVYRDGYTFEGWYDINNTRYLDSNGEGVRLWDKTVNTVLYAHWSIKNYEIRINDNGSIVWLGASGLSDTSCSIPYGTVLDSINLIATFKASSHGFKEGKIFDHFEYSGTTFNWSSVPDLGADGTIITITPIWIWEYHTIYFNTLSDIVLESITRCFDDIISLPTPIREGYIFDGWTDSSSGTDANVNWVKMPDLTPNTQSNGSTQLYAIWSPIEYYIQYNANGGTGTMNNSTHLYGEEKELNANTFNRLYYSFLGWSTKSNGSVEYNDKQTVKNLTADNNSTLTLYAVWEPYTYNIIYRNLLSGMEVYPTTYTYGEGLSKMPTIYISTGLSVSALDCFYGWYTSSSFTTKVVSISKTQSGNVYLYAKYDYHVGSTYSSGTNTITDDGVFKQIYFPININLKSLYYNDVKNTTLSRIKIEFSFDMWEVDDGYQDIYLYSGTTVIWEDTINRGSGKNTSAMTYSKTIYLNIEDYKNLDILNLRFSAHGAFSDDWQFNNFQMSVYFVN